MSIESHRLANIATINIWQPESKNFWEARRDIMLRELQDNGFDKPGSVIALQEVYINEYNPLEEIAEGLGYDQDHVHFFPPEKVVLSVLLSSQTFLLQEKNRTHCTETKVSKRVNET